MNIVLGTAQFGMDYGITNMLGITHKSEVEQILNYAQENYINTLDTAPGYGNSELVIGHYHRNRFKIITKTPHITNEVITDDDLKFVKDTLKSSLNRLNISQVYGIFIHNVADCYKKDSEKLFLTLEKLKYEGLVQKIGVSVYETRDIEMLLNSNLNFDIIQLPINVLDQRILRGNHLKVLKARGKEIYVRSIFLQGLLLEDISKMPEKFVEVLSFYFDAIKTKGLTKLESALLFINSINEIDNIIIGVNNLNQLKEINEAYKRIQKMQINTIDFSRYAVNEIDIIDPRRW
ncbi:aldo/keto reductase [Lysinibacillus endophyticus]|uniref:aldo/keto reductase n=1 Tax=Ureibacillus endophyticus TaxID=1978490 RepID=UPI0020A161DB|nr:aldo/keto reductase [Lysinibacillus endophyticus]MCP1143744.1 aldo/keto reductase [Lysinibacillus endophyticus]